jgi:hypothetical protein
MRRLIYQLLRMAKNTLQQSFQDSTLTLGKGEVTSSILVTGFGWGTIHSKVFGSSKQLLKVAFVVNKHNRIGRLGLFVALNLPRYGSSHNRKLQWMMSAVARL